MRWRTAGVAVAVTALALAGGTAAATIGGVESATAIRTAITDAMHPRVGTADATVEVGALDSRLRLPPCPALAVSFDGTSGAMMTAKVSCPTPDWTIYVPVRVHAWVDAVVAAANIAPGTTLTADLLSRRRVDMYAADGALVTNPERIEGKVLRVGLMIGAPILASFLQNPIIIHRGQRVLLTLTDGGMVIRDSVIALEDGRAGDSIAMQNPESQKVIHATIADDGSAVIRF
ncbi:MAG TPA: flagellar basal body P-ring formation chaperone FlgA [Stellaceae bacterium]|nr:flagellar basal body P-ring formation chaperone FlgA [Stellaceae bacterium]